MNKAHFSLTPRVNLAFIVMWGLGAAALVLWPRPRPILTAVVGCIGGFAAGLSQRRSLKLSPLPFLQAKSALEVRRAFMSNRPGKLSIVLQWLTALVLVVTGLVGGDNALIAVAGGYLSFMFLREVTTIGATSAIEQSPRDSQHAF